MTTLPHDRRLLAEYARTELRGAPILADYRPRAALLQRVAGHLPRAHVVVVSGPWCADCRREVPKFSRILDQLPAGWTVEVRGDDEATRERLTIRAIPTFVVQDEPGGRELGRIIESPRSPDGLEGDLVAIAEASIATA